MIGDAWLDAYLTMPIWRFVLLPGLVGQSGWAGVLMPSVDRVGRHFPLALAVELSSLGAAAHAVFDGGAWFTSLEDAALGVLPLGTANDFARELRLSGDVRACSARLATGTAREVDVVLVNSSRIFVGVGGLALVSRIALGVTRMKEGSRLTRAIASALGAVVYRFAATSSLLGWRPVNDSMRLTYREPEKGEERTTAVRGAALFVTNHRTLGGGLTLPVAAAADDGILELCVVPERARHSLLVNFARLSAGAPIAPGVIVTIPATEALVETEHEDTFVADGEPLATGRRFELRVLRRALRVIA
jgi:diacylglycerol kinase family enzyme